MKKQMNFKRMDELEINEYLVKSFEPKEPKSDLERADTVIGMICALLIGLFTFGIILFLITIVR